MTEIAERERGNLYSNIVSGGLDIGSVTNIGEASYENP